VALAAVEEEKFLDTAAVQVEWLAVGEQAVRALVAD